MKLSKREFSYIVKEILLPPNWGYELLDTSEGLVSTRNKELEGVIEILIDFLYQRYLEIDSFTDIISLDLADSSCEYVGFPAQNHRLSHGQYIRIKTLNYSGIWKVLNKEGLGDENTIVIGTTFVPEDFRVSKNYTESPPGYYLVSPDLYRESDLILFDEAPVKRINAPLEVIPKYLPLIGYYLGSLYDPAYSVAENRKFIRSAIDIYRVKGTTLSIKRVIRLLGYDCEVYEPFRDIFKSNISFLSSAKYIQSWDYYHHGVFEIITRNVPFAVYKDKVSSTVQPAGTRMLSRNIMELPLVPAFSPTDEDRLKCSLVQSFLMVPIRKSGDIYDIWNDDRRRSGKRDVWGVYRGVGMSLYAKLYRRVRDSNLFDFTDLADAVIVEKPARVFSVSHGSFSGARRYKDYTKSPYDEDSPFDKQLPVDLRARYARLPMRSDHAVRSGKYSLSGIEGDGWPYSPYLIHYYDPVVSYYSDSVNFAKDVDKVLCLDFGTPEIEDSVLRYSTVNEYSGRSYIWGVELLLYYWPADAPWPEKLEHMYDDEANVVSMSSHIANFATTPVVRILHFDISRVIEIPKYSFNWIYSGGLTVHDIQLGDIIIEPHFTWEEKLEAMYDKNARVVSMITVDDYVSEAGISVAASDPYTYEFLNYSNYQVYSGNLVAYDIDLFVAFAAPEPVFTWEEKLNEMLDPNATVVEMISLQQQFVVDTPTSIIADAVAVEKDAQYSNDYVYSGKITAYDIDTYVTTVPEYAPWSEKLGAMYDQNAHVVEFASLQDEFVEEFGFTIDSTGQIYDLFDYSNGFVYSGNVTVYDAELLKTTAPEFFTWEEKLNEMLDPNATVVEMISLQQQFVVDTPAFIESSAFEVDIDTYYSNDYVYSGRLATHDIDFYSLEVPEYASWVEKLDAMYDQNVNMVEVFSLQDEFVEDFESVVDSSDLIYEVPDYSYRLIYSGNVTVHDIELLKTTSPEFFTWEEKLNEMLDPNATVVEISSLQQQFVVSTPGSIEAYAVAIETDTQYSDDYVYSGRFTTYDIDTYVTTIPEYAPWSEKLDAMYDQNVNMVEVFSLQDEFVEEFGFVLDVCGHPYDIADYSYRLVYSGNATAYDIDLIETTSPEFFTWGEKLNEMMIPDAIVVDMESTVSKEYFSMIMVDSYQDTVHIDRVYSNDYVYSGDLQVYDIEVDIV